MCLGVPSKVVSIEDSKAIVDVLGARREISLLLIEEKVNIGDYVIVHAGFAIQRLQPEDAEERLGYFKQYLEHLETEENLE